MQIIKNNILAKEKPIKKLHTLSVASSSERYAKRNTSNVVLTAGRCSSSTTTTCTVSFKLD